MKDHGDVDALLATVDGALTMRRIAARALAENTEEEIAHRERLDMPVPDRLDGLVHVLNEAFAYWELETRGSGLTPPPAVSPTTAEYREIANDMFRTIAERIPAMLADVLLAQREH